MTEFSFGKVLTHNDTGETGSHQAGFHVPKSEKEMISFLPRLDSSRKNPDAWIECVDDHGRKWSLRYIHYNNRQHDPGGTRDEYRITHVSEFLKVHNARAGDMVVISGVVLDRSYFRLSIQKESEDRGGAFESPVENRWPSGDQADIAGESSGGIKPYQMVDSAIAGAGISKTQVSDCAVAEYSNEGGDENSSTPRPVKLRGWRRIH